MSRVCFVFALLASIYLVGPAFGQDQSSSAQEKSSGNLDVTIELMTTIMIQVYEKAEPTDEQRTKIKQIVETFVPELVRTRDKLENMLTLEQKKTFNAAQKLANKANYTADKAEAFALKKLKLPENELSEYTATKEKVDDLQAEMDSQIAALLSDEQKLKLPMLQTEKKTSLIKFKLPNMKTAQDARSIWQELMKIEGATEFKPDLGNQTAEFKVPAGAAVKKRFEEMVKAGNKLVDGWELIPDNQGTGAKGKDSGNDSDPGKAADGDQ